MIARPRVPTRRTIEVSVVLAVYALFLVVGVYSGQTTMNVDMISPRDKDALHSSPVRLTARITIRGAPLANVKATFSVICLTNGQIETDTTTDNNGIATVVIPVASGNYSWQVTATRGDYPKIVSESRDFSLKLSLVVETLVPTTFVLAVSPVDFKARVTDIRGQTVQSANVTFYVDSIMIGSNLTGQNGIAQLSRALTVGMHRWYASADKEGEGGISDSTLFVVGQLTSLVTNDSVSGLSRWVVLRCNGP
jgi:hypothetical protein